MESGESQPACCRADVGAATSSADVALHLLARRSRSEARRMHGRPTTAARGRWGEREAVLASAWLDPTLRGSSRGQRWLYLYVVGCGPRICAVRPTSEGFLQLLRPEKWSLAPVLLPPLPKPPPASPRLESTPLCTIGPNLPRLGLEIRRSGVGHTSSKHQRVSHGHIRSTGGPGRPTPWVRTEAAGRLFTEGAPSSARQSRPPVTLATPQYCGCWHYLTRAGAAVLYGSPRRFSAAGWGLPC
ncbi:uncharacterized protein PSFLO_06877 [Pseudozyma flocculosa]|uniref:Uncharacterized protein n=1 Tax=Pseudozyma flocculosa TaxID=84751 RepID=A0A5C3FCK6_9BASI|nr:uncharacterized protein PSFLO_06877 [Pseudozyma flocculosa]